MRDEGNFFKGLLWGVTLSVPLWLSLFGWVKIIHDGFFLS